MPKFKPPYDPQPERQDALGDIASKGYQNVPGDHASRLKAVQEKLGLPAQGVSSPEAVERGLRPRRWLSIAAGIAVLLVAGIVVWTYKGGEEQISMVVEQPVGKEIENSNQRIARKKDKVAPQAIRTEEPPLEKALAVPQQEELERPVVDGVATDVIAETQSDFEPADASARVFAPADVEEKQSAPTPPVIEDHAADVAKLIQKPPVASVAAALEKDSGKIVEKRSAPDAKMLAAEAEAEVGVEAESRSRFRMERAASTILTREVRGEVLEPSGIPVIGAVLVIEETGQRVVTNEKGEFSIHVTPEAVVGDVSAPGHNPLMFDITIGDDYRLFLPRISSSIPSAELNGKATSLRLIAPKAAPYQAFEDYLMQVAPSFPSEKVTVQFEVNRFGRPRQIVAGPGSQDRALVKRVRELLKAGPDWSEAYRRNAWRYTINGH